MEGIKDKVVIVTGGGRGIGFGICKAFAKEGAKLVITGRTKETLEATKEKLEKDYGIEVLTCVADGAKEEDVKAVVSNTVQKFGKLDVIVNNAQTSKSGVLLKDHSKKDFDLAIMSGLYATFFYMREAYPYLKNTKGSVINFASGAGLSGKPAQS